MADGTRTLPWWGAVGRQACFLGLITTPILAILAGVDVIDDRGLWLAARVVVAIVFTAGGLAWALAVCLRRRAAQPAGPS